MRRAKEVLAGTWKFGDVWGGLNTGMVELAPYNSAIPAEVVAEAKALEEGIKAGTLHPFQGPIKDQAGNLKVKEGETLDDGALLSMDWYVEGVEGKL